MLSSPLFCMTGHIIQSLSFPKQLTPPRESKGHYIIAFTMHHPQTSIPKSGTKSKIQWRTDPPLLFRVLALKCHKSHCMAVHIKSWNRCLQSNSNSNNISLSEIRNSTRTQECVFAQIERRELCRCCSESHKDSLPQHMSEEDREIIRWVKNSPVSYFIQAYGKWLRIIKHFIERLEMGNVFLPWRKSLQVLITSNQPRCCTKI